MSRSGDLNVLGRLFQRAWAYRGILITSFLLMITLSVLGPIRPYLINEAIDQHVEQVPDLVLFGQWMLIIAGLLILEGLLMVAETYYTNLLGQSIVAEMRTQVFRHVSGFRLKYFDKTPVGTVVTRLVSDIEAISQVFSQGIITIVGDILKLAFALFFMFYVDWKFALAVLIPIPILIIATRIFTRAVKKAFEQERLQVTRLNTFVQEHLAGMPVVQIFNKEKREFNKFERINDLHRKAHFKAIWAYSIFLPFVEFLNNLSIALLLLWGVMQLDFAEAYLSNNFGRILAFILWVHQLYRPIRMLAERFNVLQRGVVRAERVFEILDRQEQEYSEDGISAKDVKGEVVFDHVYFAYKDEDWVLNDVSFKVDAGQSVALVGATGAGKSTVINLLERFYPYQKGCILLDGHRIEEYDLHDLRRRISLVLQDVFLFSDTIMNNITMGDPTISEEQVIEAAKAVGVHEFICSLPNGYDHVVSERGGSMSVGQRQLISFIRAYVKDPSIIILDEATSAIDSESEELIKRATETLSKGRTSFMIAHRLSTIQSADLILVLDQGEIVERGTHGELLERKGYYHRLHQMQFIDKVE